MLREKYIKNYRNYSFYLEILHEYVKIKKN